MRLAVLPVFTSVFALGVRAQEVQAPAAPADEAGNARVEKMLRNLLAQPTLGFRAIGTMPSSDGKDAAKKAPDSAWIEGLTDGDTICWSRGAKNLLANAGSRWATMDASGEWLPCRGPTNSGFNGQYLPDPRFLAERLLDQLSKVQWEAGSETIDDRAVRVYRAKLDSEAAGYLLRSGALTETPTLAGNSSFAVFAGGGRVVRLAPGGGVAVAGKAGAEPERRMEITIYEDMATKLPARIKADLWGGPTMALAGARIVAVGGAGAGFGVAPEKEDDEDAAKKKDLPNVSVELEIREPGHVVLDDKVRALLGLKPPGK